MHQLALTPRPLGGVTELQKDDKCAGCDLADGFKRTKSDQLNTKDARNLLDAWDEKYNNCTHRIILVKRSDMGEIDPMDEKTKPEDVMKRLEDNPDKRAVFDRKYFEDYMTEFNAKANRLLGLALAGSESKK